MEYFNRILPHAGCELIYRKDYELLIAVMLSAQTTDKAVNRVTEVLFFKFPTLEALSGASLEEIENCIRSLGLYKNKAKNIQGIVRGLLDRYDGKVPSALDELTSLPGVGRKTANVVRCEIFRFPEFPVDTHIDRISKRLDYANEEDSVLEVEMKLRKSFPEDSYILLHHQFIHFGRSICSAGKPRCEECDLRPYCRYYKKINHQKRSGSTREKT